MEEYVILNADGWYWPKFDGGGNHGPGSCWHGLSTTSYIPEETAKFVEKKNVMVQAGGNCGLYVKQYAQLFRTVYTFEPDPVNFFCLNLNVTEPNVLKYQACLGKEHKGLSVGRFLSDVGSTHIVGPGPIPTFLIDDLALTECNLIQLDVEGFELQALEGAVETIKRCRPVIALEFYEEWAQRYDTTLKLIEDFLSSLNYEFFADIPNGHGDKIYKFKD
jgi:FkbM family methyltransferase